MKHCFVADEIIQKSDSSALVTAKLINGELIIKAAVNSV
jgi:hypothetical protein